MDFLERKQEEMYRANAIADPIERQKVVSRIEGRELAGYALSHLYFAKHGKFPEKDVLARLIESVQID